jgi:hypothetical protein
MMSILPSAKAGLFLRDAFNKQDASSMTLKQSLRFSVVALYTLRTSLKLQEKLQE